MIGFDKKGFAGIICSCFEAIRNGQPATLFYLGGLLSAVVPPDSIYLGKTTMSNSITVENTTAIINRLAVALGNVAEADALADSSRDVLGKLMTDARNAGLRFMLQSRDGKGKADNCPNRKALKTALLARFTETRARDLTGFLVLYYEAGAPIGSLRNYDAVYSCIGKTALAKLNISPNKAEKTANEKAGVVQPDTKAAPTTKAAKAAKRLVEQQGIELAFANFMEHPEFGMFTAWLALPPKKRGDDFIQWVIDQKANREIEKAKAAWIAQGAQFGFKVK